MSSYLEVPVTEILAVMPVVCKPPERNNWVGTTVCLVGSGSGSNTQGMTPLPSPPN